MNYEAGLTRKFCIMAGLFYLSVRETRGRKQMMGLSCFLSPSPLSSYTSCLSSPPLPLPLFSINSSSFSSFPPSPLHFHFLHLTFFLLLSSSLLPTLFFSPAPSLAPTPLSRCALMEKRNLVDMDADMSHCDEFSRNAF